MQGQQSIAASNVGNSSTSTGINATGTSSSSTTTTTTTGNEKSLTPTNNSNNTPPSSVVPGAATTNINGPEENDAMNSLDEQPATSGDSINKDRS